MGSSNNLLASYILLSTLVFSSILNACCDPEQDFCVATNQPLMGVFVNGGFCKDSANVTSEDFKYSGLNKRGNTNNSYGVALTAKHVRNVPGSNTLRVSLTRLDFAPGGFLSIHWHTRSSDMFTCLEGRFYVAFVASSILVNNKEKLYEAILNPGEGIVFPKGLPHFAVNMAKKHGVALTFENHEDPGVILLANSVFDSTPRINPEYLARAFLVDKKTVKKIEARIRRLILNLIIRTL